MSSLPDNYLMIASIITTQNLLTLILLLLKSVGYSFITILLYVLPGWAFLQVTIPNWKNKDFMIKACLASSVGIAIYPILMLWTRPLKPGGLYVLVPLILSVIVLGYHNFRRTNPKTQLKSIKADLKSFTSPLVLFQLLVFLLIIFSRFVNLRGLVAPMWGDSVHHTIIAQLFFENNGLFSSWLPYTPYTTLSVQYGFSSLVAVWMWLTNIDASSATLIVGQVINIIAVIALYPLAYQVSSGNRFAATSSVLLAGLLSNLPGWYINWGRYAQLAGLAILPSLFFLTSDFFTRSIKRNGFSHLFSKANLKYSLLISVTLVGMLLSYYRFALFFIAFIFALVLVWVVVSRNINRNNLLPFVTTGLITILVSGILIFPWLANIYNSSLAETAYSTVTNPNYQIENIFNLYKIWLDFFQYVPLGTSILFAGGIIYCIFIRNWKIFTIILWTIFLFSLVFTRLLRIPTAFFSENFSVLISMYLPVSIVAGWFLTEVLSKKTNLDQFQFKKYGVLYLLLFTVCVWGGYNQVQIPDAQKHSLVLKQDLAAMEFIKSELPEDSQFLAEAMTVPSENSIMGNDAGWWIPFYTLRQNNVPPRYAFLNEIPISPDYNQRMVTLVRTIELYPIPSIELIKIIVQ